MDKLKKFYKENRVFIILMGIVLVCVAIIVFILARYVLNSNTNNKYGNRLDGIGDVTISETKLTDFETKISEMEKVKEVSVNIHGKIIYFDVDFVKDTNVTDAKNVAIKCLEFLEETEKKYYDLQFVFSEKEEESEEKTFPIFGYMKAGATTISWSNNAV